MYAYHLISKNDYNLNFDNIIRIIWIKKASRFYISEYEMCLMYSFRIMKNIVHEIEN